MRFSVKLRARTAAARRAGCVATLGLMMAACSTAPELPLAGPDPATAKVRVPAAAYRPVLAGYSSQRPVDPAPWREQNERVAPAPRSGR